MPADKTLRGGQFEVIQGDSTISVQWAGDGFAPIVLATVDRQSLAADPALELAFEEFQRHLMPSFLKHRLGYASVNPRSGSH